MNSNVCIIFKLLRTCKIICVKVEIKYVGVFWGSDNTFECDDLTCAC